MMLRKIGKYKVVGTTDKYFDSRDGPLVYEHACGKIVVQGELGWLDCDAVITWPTKCNGYGMTIGYLVKGGIILKEAFIRAYIKQILQEKVGLGVGEIELDITTYEPARYDYKTVPCAKFTWGGGALQYHYIQRIQEAFGIVEIGTNERAVEFTVFLPKGIKEAFKAYLEKI